MVKILWDFLSSELISRHRNTSVSEASGEANQENQQAPELPPATNQSCECNELTSTRISKTAKLIFANRREKDIMYREELDHLVIATAERYDLIKYLH